MINILIRHTKGRTEEFKKCLASIRNQRYQKLHLIVAMDTGNDISGELMLKSTGLSYECFTPTRTNYPFYWNLYCNELKERVKQGWFFYLDDDDWLVDSHCLEQISQHLVYPYQAVICQFIRGKKPKPDYRAPMIMREEHVIRGQIGGSCIFLHEINKNKAMWDGLRAADFRFIKQIGEKVPLVYVPIPVVQAGNSGRRGK